MPRKRVRLNAEQISSICRFAAEEQVIFVRLEAAQARKRIEPVLARHGFCAGFNRLTNARARPANGAPPS